MTVLINSRGQVTAEREALMKISVLWDVTLCHWANSANLQLPDPEHEGTKMLQNVRT
jgi:hypothetical protein